ncbi:MAG TPA: methylenetetrahydrofolate reductase [Ignavibacteria bacterium]|nr:methylenetetrahydrofolate reductase [NAD(P)H] [Bacteroidota bacterium]HRI85721.1 methylenetetrahydrofolate reductase [Ignavibacteria bacterium]HRJ99287.1 methylenetetrahydrofolate reductase [Ignavibacteria bacterium]
MKVVDHLTKATKPLISFEILPLPRGGDINVLFNSIEKLMKYEPPFIDVTSHSSQVYYVETPKGISKKVMRKRPGTIGISVAIKNKFNIDTVPHILCNGFTKEETEDALIELNYLGIENILAIRGDELSFKKPVPEGRTCNIYSTELVKQIVNMNAGHYLEEDLLDASPTNFCIGISGYPEKHFEAPNLNSDIKIAKEKIDTGAHYIVTQMFFRNKYYLDYVDKCRAAGINVPIIPGLKILTTKNHLNSIPKNFFVEIPDELSNEIQEAKPEHVIDIGVEWAFKQSEELLNKGAPSLHFYIMQSSKPIEKLMKKLNI